MKGRLSLCALLDVYVNRHRIFMALFIIWLLSALALQEKFGQVFFIGMMFFLILSMIFLFAGNYLFLTAFLSTAISDKIGADEFARRLEDARKREVNIMWFLVRDFEMLYFQGRRIVCR